MSDGRAWVLTSSAVLLIDVSNYGIKEWLQLVAAIFGIGVSVIGAWKAWRFSKAQIVNRLFEYLNTDEKHVIEGRQRVLEYLRNGKGARLKSGAELHVNIEKAIGLVAADRPVEAEEALVGFALYLRGSAEVGRRHTDVASQQAATILLLVGLIAKQRKDPPTARKALTEALEHWPEDAEVLRSLGEIDLRAGEFLAAHQSLDKALALASRDKRLEAEIWSLKAEAYRGQDDTRSYPTALSKCGAAYAEIEDHKFAGDR
jgi:tetratricopeptide (TPR) repeat protein